VADRQASVVRELLSGAWFGSLLFVSAVAGRQSDFCRGRVALWSVVRLIHIIPALLVESLLPSDIFSLLVGGQSSVVGVLSLVSRSVIFISCQLLLVERPLPWDSYSLASVVGDLFSAGGWSACFCRQRATLW
jgi:hypothetical protein